MPGRTQKSFPIFIRELEVLESFRLTPAMQRVVLGGDQLGAFENNGFAITPFHTDNADDHVKLIIPGAPVPTPVQQDGHLDWSAEALDRSRDYTPRRYDPATGRLELDFVRHQGGPAAEWADTARPGDRILVAGPRGTTVLPDDIDWFFLVGDETALPAIARRIEELPAGTPVTAVVSVPSSADEQILEHRTELEISWIHRDRTPSPDAVLDAVRAARWLPGRVYAWAAGEASMLRPIRRWFRDDRGIDRDHLDVAGYWRAGQGQHESARAQMRLRERVDLAFPYAVRAAVTLGIAELVADRTIDIDQLADRVGVRPRGLTKIIRLLAHEGYFTLSAIGAVGLTPLGAILTEEFVHLRLDRASGYARLDDGWPGLLHALGTEGSGFERATGASFWQTLGDDQRLGASFDAALSDWSDAWADQVVDQLKITDGELIDVGGGTGTLLDRLLLSAPRAHGTLVELPTTAARARQRFTDSGTIDRVRIVEQSFFETVPTGGGHYLLAQVLHDWPDAECVAVLRRVAAAAGDAPVHVIERLPSADDHDHDLTFDLQLYTVFGGGERTRTEYETLAGAAGLDLVASAELGDELQLLTFAGS
ncbi:siderophore-interacting protein [Microlunatus soli]|uniref:NADPH-dependent ferric siderophore reductase, contains FAD-binding and SIP domains n=1 Tax=Microlunatus soli TaxID=630515 RepID=A0A1H1YZU3_9ACTN|nr:siderophore-interacting protein [Microlunatus soli]SDT27004.1 NADPH-dependent ferric siderophore reductase, contains FAD-binding and SIP domains [Microlunatus soli]